MPSSHGLFIDVEREWSTWQSTDPDSRGRIDALCILVYGLIPEADQGAIVHAALPQTPQSVDRRGGATLVYGRRIGQSVLQKAVSRQPELDCWGVWSRGQCEVVHACDGLVSAPAWKAARKCSAAWRAAAACAAPVADDRLAHQLGA